MTAASMSERVRKESTAWSKLCAGLDGLAQEERGPGNVTDFEPQRRTSHS